MQRNFLYHIGILGLSGILSGCVGSDAQKEVPAYFSAEKQAEIKEARHRQALGLKRTACYMISCDGRRRNTQPAWVYLFDRAGRLMEESSFEITGNLTQRQEYVYDSAGNKVKVKYYNRYNELSEIEQFDEQGYLTLSLRLTRRGNTRKRNTEITYNAEKYIQETRQYDQNQRLLAEAHYRYHENGKLKESTETHYDTRSLTLREKSQNRKAYNLKGHLIREHHINPPDTVLRTHTHQYNHKGLLTESRVFDADHQLLRGKYYTYAPEARVIESRFLWLDSSYQKQALSLAQDTLKPHKTFASYEKISETATRKLRTYNAQGLLTRTEEYYSKAGQAQDSSCLVYEYIFY